MSTASIDNLKEGKENRRKEYWNEKKNKWKVFKKKSPTLEDGQLIWGNTIHIIMLLNNFFNKYNLQKNIQHLYIANLIITDQKL
jgi:hypothetical protein